MNKQKYTILYVDDEKSNLQIFKNTFRREYTVLTALSAKEGLEILREKDIDLILTDQRMPEMDGVAFLKHALLRYPNLNRILVTAYSDFTALTAAINEAKIFQYIQKPWHENSLRRIIEQALEVYRLRKANMELTQELEEKNELLEKINSELIDYEKLKSEFLEYISHEIRTPLNGLIGSVGLIQQEVSGQLSDNMEQLFKLLNRSVNKLEQFALSALYITELKAHQYELKPELIDLDNVIAFCMQHSFEALNQKSIDLDINLDIKELKADKNLMILAFKSMLITAINRAPQNSKISIKSEIREEHCLITLHEPFGNLSENEQQSYLKEYGVDISLLKLLMEYQGGKTAWAKSDVHIVLELWYPL